MKRLLVLLLMTSCSGPRIRHDPKAWATVTQWLQGTWVATTAKGPPVKVTYRLISSNSALVESFVPQSGRETMTVIHPDGDGLVMTHYCAQENQPRLRLVSATDDELVFAFADVTNRLPDASLLVEKRIKKVGDTVEETEIYAAPNGAKDTTVWTYRRAR